MREFVSSAWHLVLASLRRWKAFLPCIVLTIPRLIETFSGPVFHNPIEVGQLARSPTQLVLVFWVSIGYCVLMAYHELRMQKKQLEARMTAHPPTRREALNAFLDGCLSAHDRLLLKPNLTRADLFLWRDRLADGIRSMTGQDPMDRQREESLPYRRFIQEFDRIPSETHNVDFVRDPLRRCRQYIEELRTTIKPYLFVTFEPSDLPQWEDIQ